jgi:hypothetical protein
MEKKLSKPLYDDTEENDIDGPLKKELEDQDLEYRFVDFKQAKALGGASRAGWRVYKRKSPDPRIQGIESLADPDGLVRKGTLVLAVKHKQLAQRQRDRNDTRRKILNGYNKQVASEVDGKARRLGGSSHAIAGYEKNS